MPKRLTATEKWSKGWFCNLTPEYKLFFIYLCENCNNAGIWEVNWPMVSFHLKANVPLNPATFGNREEDGKPRIVALSETKWFIKSFVLFQQNIHDLKELNPDNNAHKQIINILKKEKIIDANCCEIYDLGAMEGLTRPPGIVKVEVEVEVKKEEGVKRKKETEGQKRLVAPTLEEVVEYALARGNKVDPQYFFDKNSSTGWVDKNGNKYKDWKAVYRTWEAYGKSIAIKPSSMPTKRPIQIVVTELIVKHKMDGKTEKEANHEILHELIGKYTEYEIHNAIDHARGVKR